MKNMTAKKSFSKILRIIFVLSTLKFTYDAFYAWDGFSFRYKYMEFIPDFSLSFILWTVLAVIFALILWIILYVLFVISQTLIKSIRFEHVLMWFILVVSLFVVKIFYFHVNLQELIGLNRLTLRIIGILLVAVLVWMGRKFFEKILRKIDDSITPLVWLFAFLFIIAIPLSFYEQFTSYTREKSYSNVQFKTLNEGGGKRPNIILVIMDSLTALDMKSYGFMLQTTPFISEWSKGAVMFRNVYSASNWTTPSMMSIMTGQRPWTHRTWSRPGFRDKDRNYENNMPRILREYSFEVNSFVQNSYAHPRTLGIDNSFLKKDKSITFIIPEEFWFSRIQHIFKRPIVIAWLFKYNFIAKKILEYKPDQFTTFHPPEKVYNSFLNHISKTNDDNNQHMPFFAWLHTWTPHEPYLPPKPYMGVFGDAEKFNTMRKQLELGVRYHNYKPEQQEDVNILRKRYDEYILYSDNEFKLFISRLKETIDMSNTIIVLTSDHGESFSHGFQAHDGPHLYESLVRVPLIIKMPGTGEGKLIDIPVEITDIAPTILELVGIPIPEWMEGRSLVPLINGRNDSRPVFSMQLIKNKFIGNEPISKGTFAVWEGEYKLIHYLEENKSLLFNLKEDPDELNNLFDRDPETGQRLLTLIQDNLKKANERIGRGE